MSYQREFEKRLAVGVIGAGGHTYRNLLPLFTYLPIEVRAICDTDEARATKTAAQYAAKSYSDYRQMFEREKLDAVVIAVSPKLHPTLTIAALDHGLNVWLEKPPAMRASEVQAMEAARVRANKVVVVGLKKAFMPSTTKVRELLPRLGQLKTILAEYPMDIPADGRDVLERGEFNNWLGNGVHPLAFLLAVGGNVDEVSVKRGKHGGGACLLDFASGALGVFHLADGASLFQPCERYRCCAERGTVTVDDCRRVTLQRGIPYQYGITTSFAPPGVDDGAVVWEPQNTLSTLENNAWFTQGLYFELKHFCDSVLSKTAATEGTLVQTHHLMQVYEAALRASQSRHGEAVNL